MDQVASNRDHILAVAARLFSERGYEAVGVGEICATSSITKPTLYHYFGSKRGLLDAIIAERGGGLLQAVRATSTYAHDVPGGLDNIGLTMARFAMEDPIFSRMRLSMSFAPPESESGTAAKDFNLELFGMLEDFFRLAALDHGNMKGRQRAYAGAFLGTMDSYVGFMLAGTGNLDDKTVRAAVRQFMYGIFS
jgi:AcrR family transcriptional regulator